MNGILAILVSVLSPSADDDRILSLDRDPLEILEPASPAEPLTLQAPPAWQDMDFVVGARVGYLHGRDADRGTWTGGVQARLYVLEGYLGVEASIEFHQDEFLDGDVTVTTYPVQVTALLFPLAGQKEIPVQPYGLFGAGWYYTHTNYQGSLNATDDETDSTHGFHAGAGGEIKLSDKFVLNGDFRWVFIDEPGVDNSQLEDEEFDFWQVTAAVSYKF